MANGYARYNGLASGSGGGTVTSVTASSPIASSGGTIPNISLSGTVAINHGGTGQTTAANAINALLPSQTGNSGKFLSTDGSVSSWQSSGGGGANVDLSNLSSSVAINQNLTWGAGLNANINSFDDIGAGAGGGVTLRSGNSNTAGFGSSATIIGTGYTTSTDDSGFIIVGTGNTDFGNTGFVGIQSGEVAGNANSGNVTLTSGNVDGDGNTGNIQLNVGTIGGTGTRGKIQFVDGSEGTSGQVWTSTDTSGSGHWATAGGLPSPITANTTFDTIGNSGYGSATPFVGIDSDLATAVGGIFYGSTDTSDITKSTSNVQLITGSIASALSTMAAGSIEISSGNGSSTANSADGNISIVAGNGASLQLVGANNGANSNTIQMFSNVGMNSNFIKGLSDPTDPQDAATKAYVDAHSYTPPVTRVKVYNCSGYSSAASSKIFHFASTEYSLGGSDITYTSDAVNGDLFTINTAGVYSISLGLYMGAGSNVGLSLNISGTDFITVYNSLTHDKQLNVAFEGNGNGTQTTITRYCAAGDKIYPHGGTANAGGINSENFQIVRLS